MNITSFVDLVELRTKVINILLFLFGNLYVVHTFKTFNLLNAVILFFTILLFDMSTSALNKYIKYKKAFSKESSDDEIHLSITYSDLNVNLIKHIILTMFCIAILLGIYLVYRTDIIILLLGLLCLSNSLLYTCGPIPISHTPFDEVFFGVSKGLTLILISIYIHIFNSDFFTLQFIANHLIIRCNIKDLIGIILVCIPFIVIIINLMLAYNLCNIKEDLTTKRYTLPIYTGRRNALKLWELNYYITYIFIIIAVITKYLPLICLISLITFLPVKHNIDYFLLHNIYSKNKNCAMLNFLLISSSLILTLALVVFVKSILFK